MGHPEVSRALPHLIVTHFYFDHRFTNERQKARAEVQECVNASLPHKRSIVLFIFILIVHAKIHLCVICVLHSLSDSHTAAYHELYTPHMTTRAEELKRHLNCHNRIIRYR